MASVSLRGRLPARRTLVAGDRLQQSHGAGRSQTASNMPVFADADKGRRVWIRRETGASGYRKRDWPKRTLAR